MKTLDEIIEAVLPHMNERSILTMEKVAELTGIPEAANYKGTVVLMPWGVQYNRKDLAHVRRYVKRNVLGYAIYHTYQLSRDSMDRLILDHGKYDYVENMDGTHNAIRISI